MPYKTRQRRKIKQGKLEILLVGSISSLGWEINHYKPSSLIKNSGLSLANLALDTPGLSITSFFLLTKALLMTKPRVKGAVIHFTPLSSTGVSIISKN